MPIYRGAGGSGESNQNVYASDITQAAITASTKADEAADSAAAAAASAASILSEGGYLTQDDGDLRYEPLILEANRQTFYRQAAQPSGHIYREGDMWYETDTETLYFYREVSVGVYNWVPLSTGTDDSDTLDGGAY
jgi:hypothetical protein